MRQIPLAVRVRDFDRPPCVGVGVDGAVVDGDGVEGCVVDGEVVPVVPAVVDGEPTVVDVTGAARATPLIPSVSAAPTMVPATSFPNLVMSALPGGLESKSVRRRFIHDHPGP